MNELFPSVVNRIFGDILNVVANSKSTEVYRSTILDCACFIIDFGARDFRDIKELSAIHDESELAILNKVICDGIRSFYSSNGIKDVQYLARLNNDDTLAEVLLEVHVVLKSSPFISEQALDTVYNHFKIAIANSPGPVDELHIPQELRDIFTKQVSLGYRLAERVGALTDKEAIYSPTDQALRLSAVEKPEISEADLDTFNNLRFLLLRNCAAIPPQYAGVLNVPVSYREFLESSPRYSEALRESLQSQMLREVKFNKEYCMFLVSKYGATSQEVGEAEQVNQSH